jgi:hypothetical protein
VRQIPVCNLIPFRPALPREAHRVTRSNTSGAGALICLEVIINGEARTVAGAASAQTISAELCTYPELNQSWLRVSGEVVSEDQPDADANWLTAQLSVGDHVQVRVIETDSPSDPELSRTVPTAAASDKIPFVCAFCGKDAHETQGMVASHKAMICRDCIHYLYDMANEGDTETPSDPHQI